jgi:hypothetical protein
MDPNDPVESNERQGKRVAVIFFPTGQAENQCAIGRKRYLH